MAKEYWFYFDLYARGGRRVGRSRIFKIEGKDKHIFEMYEGAGRKEKKSGEMTYTRK